MITVSLIFAPFPNAPEATLESSRVDLDRIHSLAKWLDTEREEETGDGPDDPCDPRW